MSISQATSTSLTSKEDKKDRDQCLDLHENGGPKVSVSVPPVGGTRGGAAGAQNALVEAVKLGPVLHGLEVLLGAMGPGGVVVAL